MSLVPVFRFGRCELHTLRRELRLDGQLQTLGPKPFELLLLLLQQRHRAVPRQEIVETLWRGAVLSDSVLARTVMLARRAIGDSADPPTLIQTVRAFGYRFIGEAVECADERGQQPPPPAAPVAASQRIGVMPCHNASGDASLDWTQVGLMALVGHALETDPRLSVVPVTTMLEVLRGLPESLPAEERARFSREELGLAHVVHAVVRRQGAVLWLDYRVFGAGPGWRSGGLRDTEVVALGERLARALAADLLPGGAAEPRFLSRDPFVSQAFARAVELHDQEQAAAAAALFEAVCFLEPDSLVAELWRLRSLSVQGQARVVAMGERLIERATAAGELRLLALAHWSMVYSLVYMRVPADPAVVKHHLTEALRLIDSNPDDDRFAALLNLLASAAFARGDLEAAQRLFLRAEAAARAVGNKFNLCLVQQNHALLDIAGGRLMQARQRLEEANSLHRGLRKSKSASYCLVSLARVNASLGLFTQAFAQCEQGLDGLDDVGSMAGFAPTVAAAAYVFLDRGATPALERVRARFAPFGEDDMRPFVRGPRLAVAGSCAFSAGDAATARDCFRRAVEAGRAGPGTPFVRIWLMAWLRLEVAADNHDAARDVSVLLEQMPGFDSDPDLQGCVMHARAARWLRTGRTSHATGLLQRMVEQLPLGREQACARLDLAWLCLEDGDAVRASGLLAGAGAWRREHLAGMATEARLHFEQHRAAQASEIQALGIAESPAPVSARHHALLSHYRGEDAGGTFPALAGLVSDSWLLVADAPATQRA